MVYKILNDTDKTELYNNFIELCYGVIRAVKQNSVLKEKYDAFLAKDQEMLPFFKLLEATVDEVSTESKMDDEIVKYNLDKYIEACNESNITGAMVDDPNDPLIADFESDKLFAYLVFQSLLDDVIHPRDDDISVVPTFDATDVVPEIVDDIGGESATHSPANIVVPPATLTSSLSKHPPAPPTVKKDSVAPIPNEPINITPQELAAYKLKIKSNNITLPVGDNALQAFFDDPKVTKEMKKFVKDKFNDLSKVKDEQIPVIKKQLEYLLNLPGYGLAKDKRVEDLDKIIVDMIAAADGVTTGTKQQKDAAARRIVEDEIAKIEVKCKEASSGVDILKDKFIAGYTQELWDKYNFRFNNRDFRKQNSNEQYPEPEASYYPPIALDGPPGTGKTTVCKEIADIFGFGFYAIDMQTVTGLTDVLGRGTEFQGGGEASKMMQAKFATGTNSVLMVFDEIDRVPDEKVLGALAGTLAVNSSTGKAIHDNYFNLDIPTVGMSYVATTNSYYNLKSYLQNRLARIEFPGKSFEEKIAIVTKSLDKLRAKAATTEGYIEKHIIEQLEKDDDKWKKYLIKAYSYDPGVRTLTSVYNALIAKIKNECQGGEAMPVIDEKYIDACMKSQQMRKLTDKQQAITSLADEFEKLKRDNSDTNSLIDCGSKLLATLNIVLEPKYLKDNGFEKDTDYIIYATELKNYVSYEVLLQRNKAAKAPLDKSNYLKTDKGQQEYSDNLTNRLAKFAIKQQLLVEKRDSIDIELKVLESQLGEHKDDEKTRPQITRQAELQKQRDSLQERIDFADARIKAAKALRNGDTSIDSNVIDQLKAYKETLERQQRRLDGGVTEHSEAYNKISKKVNNLNTLLERLSGLYIINDAASSTNNSPIPSALRVDPAGTASLTNSSVVSGATLAAPSSNALGFSVLGVQQDTPVLQLQSTTMQLPPLGYMQPSIIPTGFIPHVAPLPTNPLASYQSGYLVASQQLPGLPLQAPQTGYPTAPQGHQQVAPLTFSSATTAQQPIPSIPINKLWYLVSTAALDKTISTYGCFITEATNPPTMKAADTVGQPPEHRHFNVQQRTEGLVMQSKVTMVDQDMVNHMIKMQMDNGNKVIHINGICKQDYTPEQTEKAKEACQMFISTCDRVGVTFSFDAYTTSVIQSQKQQLRIGGGQHL